MAQRRTKWTTTLALALTALALLAGTTGTAAAGIGAGSGDCAQNGDNSMVRRYIQQREPAMVDNLARRGFGARLLGKRQNETDSDPPESSREQQSTAGPSTSVTQALPTTATTQQSPTSAPNTPTNTQQSNPNSPSNTAVNPGPSSSTITSDPVSSPPPSSLPDSSATSASSIISSPAVESSPVTSSVISSASLSEGGVSTIIITTTQSDGSVITSQSISSAPAASQTSSTSSSSGTNHKAWIIPLSVIGGIIALSGILFIGYRCTQTRFSELDDDGGRAIRWPEILKRNEDETTVLNPLSTHRRDHAAGIGVDLDDGASIVDSSDYQSNFNEKHFAAAGLGLAAPPMGISRSASSAGSSTAGGGGSANGGVATGGPYYAGHQQGYYDPYLGASGAPYPPPRTLSPAPPHNGAPYYDPALYQHQQPPMYPPIAQPRGPSPSQGGMGSPHSGGPPSASGSPHLRSHSPGPHQGLAVMTSGPAMQRPVSTHMDDMESLQSAQQRPLSPMQAGSQPYSPYQQQAPYRLSVANPGVQDN